MPTLNCIITPTSIADTTELLAYENSRYLMTYPDYVKSLEKNLECMTTCRDTIAYTPERGAMDCRMMETNEEVFAFCVILPLAVIGISMLARAMGFMFYYLTDMWTSDTYSDFVKKCESNTRRAFALVSVTVYMVATVRMYPATFLYMWMALFLGHALIMALCWVVENIERVQQFIAQHYQNIVLSVIAGMLCVIALKK